MTTFNTATLHEITNDFGEVTHYRVVLNTGTNEYHVTDLFEAENVSDVVNHAVTNWPTAQLVIGRKI